MPTVRKHQAASVQGRTQRAQAASTRPSISAATAKAIGDREADIAEIEQRRMEGEAGVLQQRVEPVPSSGGGSSRAKGLEVSRMKARKPSADQPLDAEHARLQASAAGCCRSRATARAEQRQDQHPEQHRALVVAPGAGDLVEQRLAECEFCATLAHREIEVTKAAIRQPKASATNASCTNAARPRRAIQREPAPGARRSAAAPPGAARPASGEDEREMAEFGDHRCRRPPARLPASGRLLQRVGDLGRHVVLVVLGQHLVAREDAVVAERALATTPWPSRNRSGSTPVIASPARVRRRRSPEARLARARRFARHAAALDQPAEAEGAVRRRPLCGHVARAVEEDEVVVERAQDRARWRAPAESRTAAASNARVCGACLRVIGACVPAPASGGAPLELRAAARA